MRIVAIAGIAALWIGGLAAAADCVCAVAKRTNGWCPACAVGYVGSAKIESKMLYDELDPHGHAFDPAKLDCAACRTAIAEDGFCEFHRRGFVGGQAYLTPLAYHLAKAGRVELAELTCPVCRKNGESHGWCEACKRGLVGHVVIADRATYAAVAAEYEILLMAIEEAATCETCAVAIVFDGTCPRCGITYEKGRAKLAR